MLVAFRRTGTCQSLADPFGSELQWSYEGGVFRAQSAGKDGRAGERARIEVRVAPAAPRSGK